MKFRPCIDLHNGKVKQIIGSTLSDSSPATLKENFVSEHPPSWFAKLFRKHDMRGGHVIMLGPGNEEAARDALSAWPGGLQIGGGINDTNAAMWMEAGAEAVIVTSWCFRDGEILHDRIKKLKNIVGREGLVLDLSCRKQGDDFFIVTDKWQNFTNVTISRETLEDLAEYCSEFLIHAADVEGKCHGIETELVQMLGEWSPIPTTYAGGAKDMNDLYLVKKLGKDRIDLTIGSALDIFGGTGVKFEEVVQFNRGNQNPTTKTSHAMASTEHTKMIR